MNKKLSPQQIINNYKNQVNLLNYKIRDCEDTIRKIRDILSDNNSYTGIVSTLDLAKNAAISLRDLQEYKNSTQNSISIQIDFLTQENSKLWYMLRTIADDKTLQEYRGTEGPSDRLGDESLHRPFRKPQF